MMASPSLQVNEKINFQLLLQPCPSGFAGSLRQSMDFVCQKKSVEQSVVAVLQKMLQFYFSGEQESAARC